MDSWMRNEPSFEEVLRMARKCAQDGEFDRDKIRQELCDAGFSGNSACINIMRRGDRAWCQVWMVTPFGYAITF